MGQHVPLAPAPVEREHRIEDFPHVDRPCVSSAWARLGRGISGATMAQCSSVRCKGYCLRERSCCDMVAHSSPARICAHSRTNLLFCQGKCFRIASNRLEVRHTSVCVRNPAGRPRKLRSKPMSAPCRASPKVSMNRTGLSSGMESSSQSRNRISSWRRVLWIKPTQGQHAKRAKPFLVVLNSTIVYRSIAFSHSLASR